MTSPGTGFRLVKEHGWDVHHALHEGFGEVLQCMAELGDEVELLAWTVPLQYNLHHHIRFEDEQVLPLAAEVLLDPPPNGTVATFLEDHRLIRERLDRLCDLSLQGLHRSIDGALHRECLAVLDDLMQHHDQRETEYLYGPLGEVLDDVRQQELLDRLAETPLVTVDEARARIRDWSERDLVTRAARDYGAWVNGAALEDAGDTVLVTVLGPLATAFEKLRRRDARLVREFRSTTFETASDHLQAWRRAEQTLRTTVRFALEAMFRSGGETGR